MFLGAEVSVVGVVVVLDFWYYWIFLSFTCCVSVSSVLTRVLLNAVISLPLT